MKLPRPLIGDAQFHGFMAQVYAEMGCPHFAQLHVEQANKLIKMKEKVYLLEQLELKNRRTRMEIAKSIFDALLR